MHDLKMIRKNPKWFDRELKKRNLPAMSSKINNYNSLRLDKNSLDRFINGEFPINICNLAEAYSDCLLKFVNK